MILLVDFDGVVHSYSSGWKGANVIPDPPVEGAIEFLVNAAQHFDVQIYSSRSNQEGGIQAMKEWLDKWSQIYLFGGQVWDGDTIRCAQLSDMIKFPLDKPPAHLTIDDRGFAFNGVFPTIEYIKTFKPWNKRIVMENFKDALLTDIKNLENKLSKEKERVGRLRGLLKDAIDLLKDEGVLRIVKDNDCNDAGWFKGDWYFEVTGEVFIKGTDLE